MSASHWGFSAQCTMSKGSSPAFSTVELSLHAFHLLFTLVPAPQTLRRQARSGSVEFIYARRVWDKQRWELDHPSRSPTSSPSWQRRVLPRVADHRPRALRQVLRAHLPRSPPRLLLGRSLPLAKGQARQAPAQQLLLDLDAHDASSGLLGTRVPRRRSTHLRSRPGSSTSSPFRGLIRVLLKSAFWSSLLVSMLIRVLLKSAFWSSF